jgi:hypothetical protein
LQMQKLMGSLNDFSQMRPFMSAYRRPLYDCLKTGLCDPLLTCTISDQAKKDLLIWAACIKDSAYGLPIPKEPTLPSINHFSFVSDAAGVPDLNNFKKDAGVGGVGFDKDGAIISAFQFIWEKEFFEFVDEKGAKMGSKTTSLEILGVLINILLNCKTIKNEHIICKVDNIACKYGWESKAIKNDIIATILIRAMHVITNYLGCFITIVHLPRISSWEGCIVDRLSRHSTSNKSDMALVASFGNQTLPTALNDWIKNPKEDYDIVMKLLYHITCTVKP